MPKTLLEKIVFTVVMAAIMVYGMIVYNVALATGGVTNATFGMALHEMPIMVPVAFVLEFFVVEKLATALAFIFMRNGAVQGAKLRYVGVYVRLQFPDGSVLADVLLRPAVPLHLPCYLPPRWTERPVSLYPIL